MDTRRHCLIDAKKPFLYKPNLLKAKPNLESRRDGARPDTMRSRLPGSCPDRATLGTARTPRSSRNKTDVIRAPYALRAPQTRPRSFSPFVGVLRLVPH